MSKAVSVIVMLVVACGMVNADVIVENFESYTTTADLAGRVDGYDGVAAPFGSLELNTDPNFVHSGTKSLKANYNLSVGIHGFIDFNFAVQDWTQGSAISFWYKGSVTNSPELLWVKTIDDANQVKDYLYAGNYALTNASGWTKVVVDLTADPRFPAHFASVRQLQIIVQWGSGGTNGGTIYLDDVEIGFPDTLVVNNFESYTDTASMTNVIGYNGVAAPLGSLALNTDANYVHAGSKSLKVNYNLSGVHGPIDFYLASPQNWGGGYFSFWYKGVSTNSIEYLWIKTIDSGGQVKDYLYAGDYAKTAEPDWKRVIVDLHGDPRFPTYFSAITQVQIIVQWGSGGSGVIYLDDIEVLSEIPQPPSLPIEGDFSGDGEVDVDDLDYLSGDWLDNNITGSVSETAVDNFELYTTTSQLLGKWQVFSSASGNSTMSLLTLSTDVHAGTKAMKWMYDVKNESNPNVDQWAEIIRVLDTPVNLSQYDQLRFFVNRHADNSKERILYVKILNGGNGNTNIAAESWIEYAQGSTYLPVGWEEWVIDLHSLIAWKNGYSQLSELTNVTSLMIGTVSGYNDGFGRGYGVLDIDDMKLVKRPCSGYPVPDLNLDCKVDFADFSIFAQSWLMVN